MIWARISGPYFIEGKLEWPLAKFAWYNMDDCANGQPDRTRKQGLCTVSKEVNRSEHGFRSTHGSAANCNYVCLWGIANCSLSVVKQGESRLCSVQCSNGHYSLAATVVVHFRQCGD